MTHPKVIVVGLGYIGLPTATLIAQNKTAVYGVDLNPKVIQTIKKGKAHIVEPDLNKALTESINTGNLKVGTKTLPGNTYLIVVPTPFKGKNQPDTSFIETATREIIPLFKPGDLYIIESTSPIGTTQKMANLIYTKRPELKDKIFIAYCPERVLPGNILHELVHNDRVIGGIDKKSTDKAVDFYSNYVKGKLHKTDAKTAEMCKLVENSSRDVQIAFANELSLICDKADIDVWELIKLANKHPRVNILQPGCGVGGHCIAVDPYFVVAAYPVESKLISTARSINNYKSFWCAEKIQNENLKFRLEQGRRPKIALMGLAFKPNIDDLRESPAEHIVQKVLQEDPQGQYYIAEPNINTHKIYDLTPFCEAVQKADIVVFLVAHHEFKKLPLPEDKKIIDFCGIFK